MAAAPFFAQVRCNSPACRVAIMLCLWIAAGSTFAGRMVRGEESTADAADEGTEFYRQEVQPILQRRCLKCHDGEHHKGELDLSRRERALAGGESGPAVDLAHPQASLLLSAVRYENLEMPPTGKLPDEEIEILQKWIELGLPWDASAAPDVATEEPYISAADREHWAFQPIRRPAVPDVPTSERIANPIDAFVFHGLQHHRLQPNPEADRKTLIRRLYIDLLGIMPSYTAVQAFDQDRRPDAYERLVDELLASPQFGEQWARHWLDVVRFAETNSFERDNAKPFAWRYRDYVIRSINSDKPYQQFVKEQLAGDELDPATPESIIATGYYRLGLWDDEPTDSLQAYYDHLDDVVTITGQAIMGLTINCARCHEHKIDPIPQEDYYRFLAFFHNILKDTKTGGVTAFKSPFTLNTIRDIGSPQQIAAYQQRLQDFEARVREQRESIRALEDRVVATFSKPEQDDAKDGGVRARLIQDKAPSVLGEGDWAQLQALRKSVQESKPPERDFPQALAIRENGAQAPETFVLVRGNAHAQGVAVQPGFPQILNFPDPVIPPAPADAISSGRRRVVAEWLCDPRHPLTARVIVNRLWQHHFGKGLVRSTNDFGLQGDRPTHPELLDWLASELVQQNWSLKRVHRQMLLSSTYRMSSQNATDAMSADPQNHHLWRAEPRRLSAEQLRDAMLVVNGQLNPQMGGPSIYPEIPRAVLEGQSVPGAGWGKSTDAERARRSVYVFVKRSLAVPLLTAFDAPDSDFSCPARFVTTQPTQALTLLNSEELGRQSAEFANSLRRCVGNDHNGLIQEAYRRALARVPSAQELARGTELIDKLCHEHHLSEELAVQQFCLMVFNLNEFIYVD